MRNADENSVWQIKRASGVITAVLAAAMLLSGGAAYFAPEPANAVVQEEEEVVVNKCKLTDAVDTMDLYRNFTQPEDRRLILVNREIPIPEEYEPELTEMGEEKIAKDMEGDLSEMLRDAASDGADMQIEEGYRNPTIQETLLNIEIRKKIKGGLSEYEACSKALENFAAPGHSDHHTGYAVDLGRDDVIFERTYEYKWLMENSWKYGFIERYPADKEHITGVKHKPGHFRYVGKTNAGKMKEKDLCLEEYILWLNRQPKKTEKVAVR